MLSSIEDRPGRRLGKQCLHLPQAFRNPESLEEGVRYPGTGILSSCEPPSGSWELNPGLQQE